MSLAELSIRRPVLATVASILICITGLAALTSLPVRELPDTDAAEITIRTSYPGAAPEVIDAQVTAVIEAATSGVSGVRSVISDSERGAARTVLLFNPERDVEQAVNDVRSAIDGIRGELPEGVDAPEIDRNNSESDPVLELVLSSSSLDLVDLSDYAARFLVDALARIDGVSRVQIEGERSPAMRIDIDITRMAGMNVSIEDIVSALERNNVNLPAGEIITPSRQFQVLSDTRFADIDAFNQLVVRQTAESRVYLKDVAAISRGAEDDQTFYRANGRPAVGLSVLRQSQANTVDIAERVQTEIELLSRQLPEGTTLSLSKNDAAFIEAVISQVSRVLLETSCIVAFVIWLFLGSMRSAIIPIVTIPVSLLGAVGAMALFGFSINTITLFALILAIGLVVDDAIVVLENIERHMREGSARSVATVNATRQITGAIVATTAVLVAAFIPISMLGGEIGSLFREFGVVLAVSVAISGILALSICPVLANLLLAKSSRPGRIARIVENATARLTKVYGLVLAALMRMPAATLAVGAFVASLSVGFYGELPKELAPSQDRGAFNIDIDAPQGASLAFADRHTRQIESLLQAYKADGRIDNWTTVVGRSNDPKRARIAVQMPAEVSRSVSTDKVMRSLEDELQKITSVETRLSVPSSLGGGSGQGSVRIMLGAPDIQTAAKWSADLMERLRGNSNFSNITREYQANQPTYAITVDRDRAAALEIDALLIGETLQTLFATREVTEYTQNGRQYPIILQASEAQRADAGSILEMQVRNGSGVLVGAGNFMSLDQRTTAPLLNRFDRFPSIEINLDIEAGYGMARAIEDVYLAAETLPLGARISFDGEARSFQETSSSMEVTFALSILIVFLFMAAQFESFIKPFAILLTVPIAVASALVTLAVFGQSLNIFSQIGIVLLVGLTAKNGILVIEFANHLRAEGRAVREAAIEAAATRFRPIVMTTIATVAGAVPLAAASGTGAESQNPLGIVLVGGFLLSALFNLFLTPTLYLVIAGMTERDIRKS